MFLRNIEVPNGDIYSIISIYECDCCGLELMESDYYYSDDDVDLCRDCAYKESKFDDKEYLNSNGIDEDIFNVGINPYTNEIELSNGMLSWEKTSRQLRRDPKYYNWREMVLQRDKVCLKCGSNKNLEAHHIKKFSDYPKLRFDIKNGKTLCKECHLEHHIENGF